MHDDLRGARDANKTLVIFLLHRRRLLTPKNDSSLSKFL